MTPRGVPGEDQLLHEHRSSYDPGLVDVESALALLDPGTSVRDPWLEEGERWCTHAAIFVVSGLFNSPGQAVYISALE